MATLILLPSANLPPGRYPFDIIADEGGNRRNVHLEFIVGPPANFMGGLMGMNQGSWNLQWQGTEWAQGVFFPEVILSPKSGPVGTQISYTATNLPVGANITSINFARQDIPLPVGGVVVDSSGGFSGSFVINQAWGFLPGMYKVEFNAQKTGWSQVVASDFNLMKTGAVFSLEATPNFIPPLAPGAFGQTMINAKALDYSSVNVTLGVGETFGGGSIPGGAQAHWGTTNGPATSNVTVPSAGQASTAFYLQGNNPGRYMVTIVGWIDSNANQRLDKNIPSEFDSVFRVPLNFEIQPPQQFMNWNRDALMSSMNITAADKYLLYFPEITLSPNVGQAATKVTISATDFPAGANVTHLRFAGLELPIAATASDNSGVFILVFNVPRTMWGASIGSGFYDVEVEAQKAGEPPVLIRKPFQVTAADVAFSLKAEPDFLPPIAPGSSATTLVRVTSIDASANVTLSVDRIPPGVNTTFSDSVVAVTPGGSGISTLTLTPVQIPPG
ncbi:MAG: hypothetical protein Q7R39_07675, partial [Dehalococcoidia bacterium]|nr:hypothetical protein [Dehalococcoidia bacterium]